MKAKPNAEELAVYFNDKRIGSLARLKGGSLTGGPERVDAGSVFRKGFAK